MIYPQNFEHKIGFDEVRGLTTQFCLSNLGKDKVEQMAFGKDADVISTLQRQNHEMMLILQGEEEFPLHDFHDVRFALKRIRVEGTWLDQTELFDLKRSLVTIEQLVKFLTRDEENSYNYTALRALCEDVMVYPELVKRIDAILDKYGKVKDTASSTLQAIRRELNAREGSVSRTLQAILRNAQQEGVVDKDTSPTLRDGRLVIPVVPALKRRIKGIVHDESATGRTVYIEPAEVVEANNRIRELEGEERREIMRILQEFTTLVRPKTKEILHSYEFMAMIDFIQAKARLAALIHGIAPSVKEVPHMDWVGASHPLLMLSLARHNKKVVPLDIMLNKNRRILVISGPNAGGKSVCLKTVGLIQYMLQCGLPVPVDERSEMGVFDHLFIDIGDEQSIDDDLSTYSSHLLNMKNMMKHCDGRSLLLIDEFGGGTEPQIGGAMAEAMLKRFNQKKAFGVITTHYQNLKHFADEHEGVINGAMLYDRQHMTALFQLEIGRPGSSFAVEIARKIGIPDEVIADASAIVGQDYINADKYLQDIVRDKRYWENKRQNIHKREREIENIIARYESEISELQSSRKEIIRKAKDEAEKLLQQSNAKIENTIKSIKEAQAEKERTKHVRGELDKFKQTIEDIEKSHEEDKIARKMQQLMERKKRQEQRKEKKAAGAQKKAAGDVLTQGAARAIQAEKPLQVGDTVRIKGQTTVGTITEMDDKTAIVTFGMMRTNVKVNRLEHASAPVSKETSPGVTFISRETREAVYEKKLHFKQDIDIRGMRGDEAILAVTHFIDDATLIGVSRVRILHGTGSGILRTLVRQYLHTVPAVIDCRDEHVQFGGAGITVVDLA